MQTGVITLVLSIANRARLNVQAFDTSLCVCLYVLYLLSVENDKIAVGNGFSLVFSFSVYVSVSFSRLRIS